MILQFIERLRSSSDPVLRTILASSSPRRRQIFADQLRWPALAIENSLFDEKTIDKGQFLTPADFVMHSARHKAQEVFDRLVAGNAPETGTACRQTLVVGADTIVFVERTELDASQRGMLQRYEILEKPRDEQDAACMLRSHRGRSHRVVTGVALVYRDLSPGADCNNSSKCVTFSEETTVHFGDYSDEEIAAYIRSGEPMDKAGAYGGQGLGAVFVRGMDGDYFNVVGFPVHRFCVKLAEIQGELLPLP